MKKILLYTFMAASGIFASCNDYLDCEPITSVSTTVYLYSESDLAAYAAKFYNDSENEDNGEYGNILPSHGSGSYNMGLFDDDNGTDNQTADTPNKLLVKGQSMSEMTISGINTSVRFVQPIISCRPSFNALRMERLQVMMLISNTISVKFTFSVPIFILWHYET